MFDLNQMRGSLNATLLARSWLRGLSNGRVPNVRLQPSQHQIATSQNRGQADDAKLWHGDARIRSPEDATIAVCVLPRTELSFSTEVTYQSTSLFCWRNKAMTTAIFRQVNKQRLAAHHGRADANNRNHRDGADHPSSGTVGYTPRDRDEADHRTRLRREYLCAAAAL